MGLRKSSNDKKTYVNVQWGKLRVRSHEKNEDAVKRTDKNGNEVFEELFEELEGYITKIAYDKSEFKGKVYESLEIALTDSEGDNFHVKSLWGSKSCKSFLARAESIDFTQPVLLCVYEIAQEMDPTKSDTYLVPKQHGDKIAPNYGFGTEKPWQKPAKVKVSGKEQNDYTEQLEEMERIVSRVVTKIERESREVVIAPAETRYDKVGASVASASAPGKYNPTTDFDTPSPVAEQANSEDDDYSSDLPF